jgi:hypothetical protein
VSESFGDIKQRPIFGGQLDTEPAQVGSRFHSQINDDVEDDPASTANEFCFSVRRSLKMHAAQGPASAIVRDIALSDFGFQSEPLKLVMAPTAREESPFVFDPFWFDNECSTQGCLMNLHGKNWRKKLFDHKGDACGVGISTSIRRRGFPGSE